MNSKDLLTLLCVVDHVQSLLGADGDNSDIGYLTTGGEIRIHHSLPYVLQQVGGRAYLVDTHAEEFLGQ